MCLFLYKINLNYIFIFCIFTLSTPTSSTKLKNVLLIFVDDLRHLSDTNVSLPNIQTLAKSGADFKNAFAQQSLCAPSRNSILTGRRPDTLRLYDFYSYWREFSGNFTTIPQFFKDNGYETYSIGKVFHPGASSNNTDDYPYSWSRPTYHPSTEMYKDAAVCRDRTSKRLQKNLICPVHVKKQPENTLPDLQTLNYGIDILKNNQRKDILFMMAIGFHKPHIPLKYPKKYLARIPIENITLPVVPNMPQQMPLVSWHPWNDIRQRDDIKKLNIPFPLGTMPSEWTKRIKQSYYAAALYIDDLIGILMKYVDKSKTIVVLVSDHGWSLGENGLWAKYSNFDAALKVPLIINAPDIKTKIIKKPVELIDIFPTLVELSGIKKKIKNCNITDNATLCFAGKSLVPLMTETINTSQYFATSQYPRPSIYPQKNSDKPKLKQIKIMGYSIRTERYRYTEWISFNHTTFMRDWDRVYSIELYDHKFDPFESDNVIKNPNYNSVSSYLTKLLRNTVENR